MSHGRQKGGGGDLSYVGKFSTANVYGTQMIKKYKG